MLRQPKVFTGTIECLSNHNIYSSDKTTVSTCHIYTILGPEMICNLNINTGTTLLLKTMVIYI